MSHQTEFFFKVVLIGAPNVGKTCILERFVEDKFSENYKATIGADFRTKDISVDDKTVMLQIWDTAGQERFRALAAPFYRGANICILVFDVSQKLTFQAIENWRDEFLHHADIDDADKFPFLLIGNKTDLDKKTNSLEVEEWIKEKNYNIEYIETSAKDDVNISEAFLKVARLCLKNTSPNSIPEMTPLDSMSDSSDDDEDGDEEEEQQHTKSQRGRDDDHESIDLEKSHSTITDVQDVAKEIQGSGMCGGYCNLL